MNWNDLHNTTSNILGITLIGVLGSTLTVEWWSCGDGPLEVNRIWTAGSVIGVTGICVAVVARHYQLHKQVKYWTEVILRFLLVYAIFTTALLKAEGHFYNYSLFYGETKLANLEANSFANAFYGFSPMFQAYVGYVILGGLALICFKQTQRIGNVLLGKVNIEPEFHPLSGLQHLSSSNSLFKVILLVGFFFYTQDYIEDVKNYRSRNVNSPVTGVWKVMDVQFLKSDLPEENKRDIQQFKSIILDKGRFGAVEIADSLSFFEYIIDSTYNQLEFWNFQDFWEMNIKGKYRKITEDSMIYIGRNRKDSLQILLKKDTKK